MEGSEVFALIRHEPGFLDKPLEELVQMKAVGQVYLDTHRSILKQIKSGNIELAETDRAVKLQEGQAIGKALLDVEAKIGELLPEPSLVTAVPGGDRKRLPGHIDRGSAHKARTIANNPEAVAAVIKEAEDNDDIPTKTAVINKVRAEKAETRARDAEGRAAEKKETAVDKEVQGNKRFVREYFDSARAFGKVVEKALVGAKAGKFDPDSKNFTITKHDDIRDLMNKLEELI